MVAASILLHYHDFRHSKEDQRYWRSERFESGAHRFRCGRRLLEASSSRLMLEA